MISKMTSQSMGTSACRTVLNANKQRSKMRTRSDWTRSRTNTSRNSKTSNSRCSNILSKTMVTVIH